MRKSLAYSLQSLRSVQAFLDANAGRMPAVAMCGARRRLDELVTAADARATEQRAAELDAQIATRRFHALRTALVRGRMAPIVTVAAVEELSAPGLSPLRMPPRWATPEALHAHAAGMAAAAAPYAAAFSAAGLGDDFADRLIAAADAMLDALGERTRRLAARSGATKGLAATLRTGRLVVDALDAMVTSEVEGNPALLAEWAQAKRVERVRGAARAAVLPALPAPVQPLALIPAVSSASEAARFQTIDERAPTLVRLRFGRLARLFGGGARRVEYDN
ncbi:MAG: hypothetical protein KGO03_12400 [Gemmatimonadota bacterium]|nr:hypothetical protein [Gemmatimonadota bacterium]